jgi:hypothetical protein
MYYKIRPTTTPLISSRYSQIVKFYTNGCSNFFQISPHFFQIILITMFFFLNWFNNCLPSHYVARDWTVNAWTLHSGTIIYEWLEIGKNTKKRFLWYLYMYLCCWEYWIELQSWGGQLWLRVGYPRLSKILIFDRFYLTGKTMFSKLATMPH